MKIPKTTIAVVKLIYPMNFYLISPVMDLSIRER